MKKPHFLLDNTGALVYNGKRVKEATSPIGHPRLENSRASSMKVGMPERPSTP